MSEETPNNENVNSENKKSSSVTWILICIIALLAVAVLGWMYSKKSKAFENCQTSNAQMKEEMDAMNDALSGYVTNTTKDLKHDLKEMLSTYDALIKKDSSKTDSLMAQKDSIKILLTKLDDNKNRSFYEISKLKKRNQTLREIMNRYLVTIDSLHTINVNLSTQLDVTSTALNETQGERDELKVENEKNADLLTKGAKLNAFNFNSEAMRYKRMGDGTKDENRAKKAEVISSTFTIGANTIAETGNKMIYMQIIDPNGQVLYKRPNDVTQIAGSEILYSGKREVNYQGQILDMTIVYNLEGKEVAIGNYIIKVFADGALIGKDTFTLK